MSAMSPLSSSFYHPRRISSTSKPWDTIVEEEGKRGSCGSDLATKPSQQRLSQHTYLTRRSTTVSRESSCVVCGPMQHHAYPQHGPAALTQCTVTESTKYSSVSSLNISPIDEESNVGSKIKKSSRRKLRIGRLGIPKLPKMIHRRKQRSESQLRKRVRKSAERGDWDSVRTLLSNYEFSEIPEVLTNKKQQRASLEQKRDNFVPEIPLHEEPTSAARRPSYGSRNGERRSFTGKESTAAAAAILSSLLEESLESLESAANNGHLAAMPDFGENVLHDVCRYCPPLDVTETLLKALRHRRGVTSGTDDFARTPLHLAAHYGAAPEVIDALVRADPSPATMGDMDKRSPLHLAMRSLAYGRYTQTNGLSHKHGAQYATPSSAQALDQTCQTVLILKNAMLTYPGRIDFKDEDDTGFSPLDYGLDGNVSKEELLHSLSRRKEPRFGRSKGSLRTSFNRRPNMRRLGSTSSISDDQDIEILRQLEQDEIEARRLRIQKLKSCKQKTVTNDALFHVFGIEGQPAAAVTVNEAEPVEEVEPKADVGMTDEAIYERHVQDYLDDYMDDFEGCEGFKYCGEDGFDILEDPDEARVLVEGSALQGDSNVPPMIILLSDSYDDDECDSVVSEITAPLKFGIPKDSSRCAMDLSWR